jgi:hypothetical protein
MDGPPVCADQFRTGKLSQLRAEAREDIIAVKDICHMKRYINIWRAFHTSHSQVDGNNFRGRPVATWSGANLYTCQAKVYC